MAKNQAGKTLLVMAALAGMAGAGKGLDKENPETAAKSILEPTPIEQVQEANTPTYHSRFRRVSCFFTEETKKAISEAMEMPYEELAAMPDADFDLVLMSLGRQNRAIYKMIQNTTRDPRYQELLSSSKTHSQQQNLDHGREM